jgi:PKD repeat protein
LWAGESSPSHKQPHLPFFSQGEKMKHRIFSICLVVVGLLLYLVVFLTTAPLRAHAQSGGTPTSTAIPGADFSGTPLAGSTPLTVQFTALNSSVLSTCTWTFGDGTSQTFNTPAGQTVHLCPSVSHVYTTTGVYSVKLSVMKVTGATNSMTKPNYIQVTNPGEFTATPTKTPIPCGAIIVVTSTFTPTITATPTRTQTATATSCGPIYQTATPSFPTFTPTATSTGGNLPDLTVSSVTYLPSNPACINSPKVQVVVANIGTSAATGSFSVSLSGSAAQTVNGLAAGQSVTLIFSATGTMATADSTNVIVESNESNNSLAGSFGLPTQAHTCTPTSGTPLTPTRTFTPTVMTPDPTPGPGGCSPVTSIITAPFTWDGAGVYCWQIASIPGYVNNWNNNSVSINGVNFTNVYVAAGGLPPKINNNYYISFNGPYAWSHLEVR